MKRGVEEVLLASHDPEVAHSKEDELHRRVLREIANGADDPMALAEEALQTLRCGFARWYA